MRTPINLPLRRAGVESRLPQIGGFEGLLHNFTDGPGLSGASRCRPLSDGREAGREDMPSRGPSANARSGFSPADMLANASAEVDSRGSRWAAAKRCLR